MFQSIKYRCYLGYNAATKLHEDELDLIDSDFSCVVVVVPLDGPTAVEGAGAVIQEYSKRNLNVAANLIWCFRFYEKKWGHSIEQQIAWAEDYQPLLFTPALKADLQKYITLL
jgi:hypothetical protein